MPSLSKVAFTSSCIFIIDGPVVVRVAPDLAHQGDRAVLQLPHGDEGRRLLEHPLVSVHQVLEQLLGLLQIRLVGDAVAQIQAAGAAAGEVSPPRRW